MKKIGKISKIINLISESTDELEVLKYENLMTTAIAVPVLLIGAGLNFILGYYLLERDFTTTAVNSLLLFIFSILFQLFQLILKNEEKKYYIFLFLSNLFLYIVVFNFYKFIGLAF